MSKANDVVIELTREELFDRVWTTAMRQLAPDLGLSDVGLKKLCRRLRIPTPPVGYWAKKQHGKTVRRPRLPAIDGESPTVRFWPNARVEPEVSEAAQAAVERERSRGSQITVPDDLVSPLPIVVETMDSLSAARPDQEGIVRPRRRRLLDVAVAPESIDRACRILDALLKALADRGLDVQQPAKDGGRRMFVRVSDEDIPFALHELVHRQERPATPAEKRDDDFFYDGKPRQYFHRVPSGRLSLVVEAGVCRSFSDTSKRRLENLLNGFIVGLYRAADGMKRSRVREAELELERQEAERRRQEFEQLRSSKLTEIREEEQHLDKLRRASDAWHAARRLEAYVAAVEQRADRADETTVAWLAWARDQVDRLDPLTPSPHSILDEKDKWTRYW